MPNPEVATYFPRGVNNYVNLAQYHCEVGADSLNRVRIGSGASIGGPPVAANASGYFSAVSVAATNTGYNTFAGTYTAALQSNGNATYGRGVVVTASGAYAGVVVVHGRDYLGQPMSEAITANGTTPVNGKKAFSFVDSFDTTTTAAATTINIGWTDVLGLPFAERALVLETVNFVTTANAGTFVGAINTSPQTLTSGDPRGTYTPNAANATNGTNTYQLLCIANKDNLYGVQHSYT